MRRSIQVGLILIALVLVYLAMLPATWLNALLQRSTQGTLAMTGTQGTLWRGEGTLQALLPSGEAVTLAPASWEISLRELLALRLHLTVDSQRDNRPLFDASLSPGETSIQRAKLQLPAELLGVLSPTLRAASLSGQLVLQADDVRLEDKRAAGKVKAIWMNAGSRLSRVNPLGNYELDLDGKGDGMDFRLVTLGGPLNLSGSGHWQPGQKPDIKILATPTASKRQDLAPMLRVMGSEIRPGTYQMVIGQNVQAVSGPR